jgi:hypothetical protein
MSADKQHPETPNSDRDRVDRADEAERPQKQPSRDEAKPGERGDQSRDPQGGRV